MQLLSQKKEKDSRGSVRRSGQGRRERRRPEAGAGRAVAAARAGPREPLPEAPGPGGERTARPASEESPLFPPHPRHAEIFIRENKTIKDSQITENVS